MSAQLPSYDEALALLAEGHCPFDRTRLEPRTNCAGQPAGWCPTCSPGMGDATRWQPGWVWYLVGGRISYCSNDPAVTFPGHCPGPAGASADLVEVGHG